MSLKDAGNTSGFSAAVSEPPFQQNTHCFAVGGHAKWPKCWRFSILPKFLKGAELAPAKDKHVPLQFTWKEPQSSTKDCPMGQVLGSRRVSRVLPAPKGLLFPSSPSQAFGGLGFSSDSFWIVDLQNNAIKFPLSKATISFKHFKEK